MAGHHSSPATHPLNPSTIRQAEHRVTNSFLTFDPGVLLCACCCPNGGVFTDPAVSALHQHIPMNPRLAIIKTFEDARIREKVSRSYISGRIGPTSHHQNKVIASFYDPESRVTLSSVIKMLELVGVGIVPVDAKAPEVGLRAFVAAVLPADKVQIAKMEAAKTEEDEGTLTDLEAKISSLESSIKMLVYDMTTLAEEVATLSSEKEMAG